MGPTLINWQNTKYNLKKKIRSIICIITNTKWPKSPPNPPDPFLEFHICFYFPLIFTFQKLKNTQNNNNNLHFYEKKKYKYIYIYIYFYLFLNYKFSLRAHMDFKQLCRTIFWTSSTMKFHSNPSNFVSSILSLKWQLDETTIVDSVESSHLTMLVLELGLFYISISHQLLQGSQKGTE